MKYQFLQTDVELLDKEIQKLKLILKDPDRTTKVKEEIQENNLYADAH